MSVVRISVETPLEIIYLMNFTLTWQFRSKFIHPAVYSHNELMRKNKVVLTGIYTLTANLVLKVKKNKILAKILHNTSQSA
jgi:hypothetical protein